jgi:hypothetical protein
LSIGNGAATPVNVVKLSIGLTSLAEKPAVPNCQPRGKHRP